MKGFKITCLECGAEVILTQGELEFDTSSSTIEVTEIGCYECEGINIECSCGNMISEQIETNAPLDR